VNETLTVLNSINEKLGLVLEMLSADSTPVKPKYVEVAERVLSVGNAALEEVVPAIIEEEVDTLVLAQGHTPENSLEEELNDYLGEVISIGDCQMPRTCEEAVLEGLRAAHNLG